LKPRAAKSWLRGFFAFGRMPFRPRLRQPEIAPGDAALPDDRTRPLHAGPRGKECALLNTRRSRFSPPACLTEDAMSLGMILIIVLIILMLGSISGRFGGHGYGIGHSGTGLLGVILVVVLVLVLLNKI
jgi:uncharacterized protein DUF3309